MYKEEAINMNGLFGGSNGNGGILGGISPVVLILIVVLLTSGCGGIGNILGGGDNTLFIIIILFFCLCGGGLGNNACSNEC